MWRPSEEGRAPRGPGDSELSQPDPKPACGTLGWCPATSQQQCGRTTSRGMTAGWVGTELPVGPTQRHLACQHASGRGCFWGSVPATGQVRGCLVDLSLQSPDIVLEGGTQLSAQFLGPPCPHFHLQTRVEGHGLGEEAGPAPGSRWTLSVLIFMIRTCAAAMRPAGAVLCGSLPENVCRQVGSG